MPLQGIMAIHLCQDGIHIPELRRVQSEEVEEEQ